MKILGIDPSMRNTGFALGQLDLDTLRFMLLDIHLVETNDVIPKTKTVRQNSIDLTKARALQDAIESWTADVAMVFVEMPVGSQSARAMASYGMCLGVLASIRTPMIQVTPTQVKLLTTGNKSATKQEMIDWAVEAYPTRKWLKRGGKLVAKNEHLADAVGTIHAGLQTEEFKSAMTMMRYMRDA